MVETKKFKEIGGFDEGFPVTYNDVDLCFRLVKQGYYNVLRNDVALIHHESVSRGFDEASVEKEERRKREMARLYEKNPEFAEGYDPCYNPNLAPNNGDFAFDMSKAYLLEKPEKTLDWALTGYTQSTELLKLSIDSVLEDEDTIRVNGWAYLTEKQNNNHNKIKLVLRNTQGKSYMFESQKLYRSDVMRANGSRKGLSLTGFESVVLKDCIPTGKYEIGVAIGKNYAMSDKTQEL